MTYAILTFGCRVNQADSLQVEEGLVARGLRPDVPERADLVIVNSCSVTATADQGVRQAVRRVARLNPAAKVVVTGCYATRRPDEVASLPNVLRIVPNMEKGAMVDELAASLLTTTARFGDGDGPCGAPIAPGAGGRTAYTLCVQTGCAERCAYCIIPATRGRSRSVPVQLVLDEASRVAAAGFKEIALTGVHLGSYGRDLSPATTLTSLLEALARVPGDVTFRVSSLEPMDCGDDIVDLVAREDRFAPHFHLPLQHASDRLLGRMRRPYTIGRYRRLVDRIRAGIPHAAIGSDLIVGFPGETEDDVDVCARYLSESPLTHLHVFSYSDRPGTAASGMAGRPPGATVRARGARLREIGARLRERFRGAQLGTVRPGLTLEDGSLVVTDNYLKVRIPAGRPRNERVRVRIDAAGAALTGHVV